MKANTAVIVISIIIILCVFIGLPVGVYFVEKQYEKDAETDKSIGTEDKKPIIEFENGNEMYFDESLVNYLTVLEKGCPLQDEKGNYLLDEYGYVIFENSYEKEFESVMDTLILLINKMAMEEFSMDASHQVQRFYVKYFDRIGNMEFDELFNKIRFCFLRSGASKDNLKTKVEEAFGFNTGDDLSFVFSPFQVEDIKVQFYNVRIENVEISESLKALSIYDTWKNPYDEGFERNLEAWLHSVIKAVKNANLSDEKAQIAQVLYAGSLANAEYKQDWEKSLINCLTIEDFTYDSFKREVENEFNVSIDFNESLKEYFKEIVHE